MIGKTLTLPLVGREIPIVGDEHADMEFGTGCVKITPCHDPNDFEVGLRHDLPQYLMLDGDGKITGGYKWDGMDRYEARKAIVQELEEQGYLVSIEPCVHNVGTCSRCHNDVEPLASDQWFVKMQPLAKEAIRVVEEGEIKFVPDRFAKTYLNWMNSVRDWCISRQLWWGHQIPVWYCGDCGHMTVSRTDACECEACHSKNIRRERRARHLVLQRALAVLHARLAGQDGGSGLLLSDGRARHGLRHHLLLGRAHDLLRLRAYEEDPVPHGAHPRPDPRPAGARKCPSPPVTASIPSRSSTPTARTRSASTSSPATRPETTCASSRSAARRCATLPTSSGTLPAS